MATLSLLVGPRHPIVAAVIVLLLAQGCAYVWSQYVEDSQLLLSGLQPLVTLGLKLTVVGIR